MNSNDRRKKDTGLLYKYSIEKKRTHARMVKLVDTYVSDAYAERCEGSSPSPSNS